MVLYCTFTFKKDMQVSKTPNLTHQKCLYCGKISLDLKTCGKCKSTKYCSKECQVTGHRVNCAELCEFKTEYKRSKDKKV
jgi:hypothetical protein